MILNKFKPLAVTALVATFLFSCSQDEQRDQQIDEELVAPSSSNIIEGQYIVVFNKKVTGDATSKYPESYTKAQEAVANTTKKVLSEANIPDTELLAVYSKTINGVALKLNLDQVESLRKKKEIAFIEEDRIVQFAPPCGTPNGGPCDGDPGDGDDGSGGDSGQETPYGIARVNGVASYTGSNVAWVIDSGIDTDHPDLNVDASRGFNAFTSGRDGKSTDDGNGHGTHVAGTIAALNNNIGVIGVAPGATVIPIKVLDSRGSGSYSGVIAGVDHVAAYGSAGDVANMSLGGPTSDALDNAILSAAENGIIFALAAGNESSDANTSSPARVNGANIVTISAMDSNDNWASFSNYGNPPVDYAAPGVAVNSTWKDGGYNSISGTSMASPHAAGVLLLGPASTDGTVNGDPDGTADPIIVH
ncbi:S8 family peptidase [Salegentibacter mishustinae]|uniref:Peptidase S8 n=1 Tax=Salegentibacter mishustinae TaxID=270918 RepID=A0A0Q9ZJT6_9FLAO|nr:S8 family peptidase [Salegentibacter mishustinae]KRG30354.1 peptidase S8 [Salegentibacter mishustinae]PNW23250.1 peptidase S8 [Salegentibacter mishustinae]PZX66309.1 peptidase inhibitor I9 [Salegentibacter mishustinae]GGW81760.1 subtilisin E [Salegentibacter mishustinae]